MPASRGNGILQFRDHWTGICNYQYQNILDRFKIKTLIVRTGSIPVLFHPFNEGPKVRLLNIKRHHGEVEREARQPRARQRHLRCGAPPNTRITMGGLGLHP